MDKIIERGIEFLKRTKKKIIKAIVIGTSIIVVLGVIGGGFAFYKVKSNINYSEEQAKEIALKEIPGEVVSVEKDLELDEFTIRYEIKIKNKQNILEEVTVDANYGTITEIENHHNRH